MFVLLKHPEHKLTTLLKRTDSNYPDFIRKNYQVVFEHISRKVVEKEQIKRSVQVCQQLEQ